MSGDLLAPILARKAKENARRRAHLKLFDPGLLDADGERSAPEGALTALRRDGAWPKVIAEVKFQSPSAGVIRPRAAGDGVAIARGYARAGAAAISVLCDRAGFGGSVLELRRVAQAVDRPVLFKEFVLDPLQLDLARVAGASMVLLLVRALDEATLTSLVDGCLARGLEPVVEAADEAEVERAVATRARVIGVNARDLSTFRVDPAAAARAVRKIPNERVKVYMSGVSTRAELREVAETGADAVLMGTALIRAPDPGERLAELLGGAR